MENQAFEFNAKFEVDDVATLQSWYEKFTGHECNLEKIKECINESEDDVIYLSNNFGRLPNDRNAYYALIPTGDALDNGEALYISMRRCYGAFVGHVTGTIESIGRKTVNTFGGDKTVRQNVSKLVSKLSGKPVQSTVNDKSNSYSQDLEAELPVTEKAYDKFYHELATQLLINNWAEPQGFRRFLLILGARVKNFITRNETDYFVKNSVGHIVLNTGLLNKFGMTMAVMYRYSMKDDCFFPYKIMNSKSAYIEEGFTLEDASKELKPITFTGPDTPSLSTNILEYDMNFEDLVHCIDVRRERFPESVRNISDIFLAQKIQQELSIGLTIHRCGGTYAKAIYKPKMDCMQWLLPLHINTNIGDVPELVMVIGQKDSFYVIKTVLAYDNYVKDCIRATTPYDELW